MSATSHDEDETAYAALAAAVDDARWAFGTGFTDPLAGVDPAVPDGVDREALSDYCRMLGDDALVLSHRLQEWVTRLPELEEEAAVANIALDLLGQARRLLTRSGQAGDGRSEDDLAYLRDPAEFRCVRLVQLPIEDFAVLVVRVLVVSTWRAEVMRSLSGSADPVLGAIATQAVKELDYHRQWASSWLVHLGDGTDLSHDRVQAAVDGTWPYLSELFDDHPVELRLEGTAVTASAVRETVIGQLSAALEKATLQQPQEVRLGPVGGRTGRDGGHTDHLSRLLAEMQSVARALPGAVW